MAKKSLGKGLNAIFSIYDKNDDEKSIDEILLENETNVENRVVNIPLTLIDPDRNQPRKNFDEKSLIELADSIKLHGVIQPITVVKTTDDRYKIIAGERRWRASKICGKHDIPCIIREYTPQQMKEIAIIENLQRENLNPIESAEALKSLMDEYNWTHEQLANRLSKSRSAITNTLRLLNLIPEVKAFVITGELSAGHAKTLAAITDSTLQLKLAKQSIEKKYSVRDLEKAMTQLKKQPEEQKPIISTTSQSNELKEFQRDLQRVFGTKVSIIGDDNRGKIQIEYFDFNDLERIFELVEKLKK